MATFPQNDIISLTGETVRYDLAESVGPDLRLGDLLAAAGDADLGDLMLGYRTAEGDARLREIIAEQHGVTADDVVITVGGMQALFLIAFILCDPGDEAVTTSPLFPLARNVLEAVRADVKTLPLSFERGYRLDLEDLARQLSSATKLVSLASPQNPSGVAMPAETVRDVIALMAVKCPDAYLLLDETYRDAIYGDDAVVPSGVTLGPKVISCASLSKCHGAPGLRLGWAISRDPALREQLVLGKFNTTIANSAIDEALALKVLEQRDRIIGARRRHLADGLARTAAWVEANAAFVDWVRPDAGALCCVRLKPTVFDQAGVDRFYAALAAEGVRVGNGAWFGDEARIFRLGFGLMAMPDLEAALDGLSTAVHVSAEADAG